MADSSARPEVIGFSIDDLGAPIELQVNTSYRLVLDEEPAPVADLDLVVMNYVDKMPLEGAAYELDGCGRTFSGRTGKGGAIRHTRIPAGCYHLEIEDRQYSVPTDPEPGRSHVVYVVADARGGRQVPEYDEADLKGLSDEEIAAILEGPGTIDDDGADPEPA